MMRNSARLCNTRAFLTCVREMASSDSRVTSRANKWPTREESSSLLLSDKYSFKGKRLTSQTNHLLMNVVEYFKKEARAIRMFLEKYPKQPVRQQHDIEGCVRVTDSTIKVFQ